MSNWDTIFECPICKADNCVPARGNKNSPVLIIGEFPGKEETKVGKPLVGPTGRLLASELLKCGGIDIKTFRLCNLWLHEPNGNKECFQYGINKVLEDCKDKKVILLLGSETVKFFCDVNVSDVSGLEVVSQYLSAPLVMASVNPAIAFKAGGIGEVRLSLQKFARRLEEIC